MTSKLAEIVAFCAFVVWFVLFGQGCDWRTNPTPGTFQVSSAFTDQQLDDMRAAAAELCEASNGTACADLTRMGTDNQIVFMPLMPRARGNTHYEQASDTIAIQIDSGERNIPLVFRHELGHAMGCRRELPPGNIMSPDETTSGAHWTQADLDCIAGR
jgi:hypothetical protein